MVDVARPPPITKDGSVPRTTRASTALAAVALVLSVACGGPSGTAGTAGGSAPPGGSAPAGPVTVRDCKGRESTFGQPPRRVVALTSSMYEMLFWLGVGDRIVGIGAPPKPGTMPAEFDAGIQALPKLAGAYAPGNYKPVPREKLLEADPDFVVGGWTTNFDAPGATSQDELTRQGIPSYFAFSTSCDQAADKPLTDFELVYRDLTNLGNILGVPERAASLVATMKGKAAGVQDNVKGEAPPAVFPFEFDEGTETPTAPGNRQSVNAVISQAGGRNIWSDIDKAYGTVSWEQVAQRNPDVVMIVIYDNGDAGQNEARFAEAERFVRGFAPLADTSAVKNGRFARTVAEKVGNGGVRNADAVVELARSFHPAKVS
jgi:iron complex transport system substrate-binding protein